MEIRLETNSNYLLFKKREVLHRNKLVTYWRNSHIEKLSVFADLATQNYAELPDNTRAKLRLLAAAAKLERRNEGGWLRMRC